jgi:Fur family ferric uptake transcriptional regulator
MNRDAIRAKFEAYLRKQNLRLTPQRRAIFERAFDTHQHFTAEELYNWLQAETGKASRATVYRTLALLVEGEFLESLDVGAGELRYEHVVGHRHHDHMVCVECGRIEEFVDERIEALQEEACRAKGFQMHSHNLRIFGLCRTCVRARRGRRRSEARGETGGGARGGSGKS